MAIIRYIIFSFLISTKLYAQLYSFQKVETNTNASFRAISVVNSKVAWVSGTVGTIGLTTDGGVHWTFKQIPGFESLDFRSLYAFDAHRAVIANAGSPAHILITTDGGKTWNTSYTNSHPDIFFDGLDFWNDQEGVIYGDPIDGKMVMLQTTDGGVTWNETNTAPLLEKGEASFAASCTGIRCAGSTEIMLCTGGTASRLWFSNDKGLNWSSVRPPILQGESTTGIFSFAKSKNMVTIVGGDYKNESQATNHHFYSTDNGKHWVAPTEPTRGYRECVEVISNNVLIVVGPTGADISIDNGLHWKSLSDEKGLHVIQQARKGNLVITAGNNGQVFILRKKSN